MPSARLYEARDKACTSRIGSTGSWHYQIDPDKVFDLGLPLVQVVEGYRARDERRVIKMLLRL